MIFFDHVKFFLTPHPTFFVLDFLIYQVFKFMCNPHADDQSSLIFVLCLSQKQTSLQMEASWLGTDVCPTYVWPP